ncbi:very-long-chain aldehyde decarbonylase CER1 isoform X2 [Rosa chinensis]|uniref:very-long-chain aldehyde decarbonylase CER1 isoform X2 n=1 Tax=Rosa chinensis TaxID=74649 RepID=UPI001AD8EA9F|nr:very-long-chain aldehyde decarbonylase CER1 isoform X2 [Rosa chinensis]
MCMKYTWTPIKDKTRKLIKAQFQRKMASNPGILTEWPWTPLGNFKYVVAAPWAIHSIFSFIVNEGEDRDLSYFLIFPFMLFRMLHNQLWISLSRYKTSKGSGRIIDKGLEFEQVDRERNCRHLTGGRNLPMWRGDGFVITFLLHAGPVEFLYYWLHRALHHHYLYSRYHSHHHSSIVTEPITSVIHPFGEHIAYFLLFAIPLYTMALTGTGSIISYAVYVTYIDLMNNMGHCNFELIPNWTFSLFPPLKYFIYTPSYHSLHHTLFRTNYCLFMPLYDYIYGTMEKTSDELYESSLKRKDEAPDVLHLTHLTTPDSIYQLPLGFASLASEPHTSTWYMWLMWPVTFWSMILTWIYGRTFVVERQRFDKLKLQTWAIPKYNLQYFLPWQNEAINSLIEEAILKAEEKGVKVVSLGLLNQGGELNRYGGLYTRRYPQLKVKVVDGSSLAVAVILNSIPKETTQVVLTGNLTKVAYAIAFALGQRGIEVATLYKDEYLKLTKSVSATKSEVVLAKGSGSKIWLVGDGLRKDQLNAPKGTMFVPFSQFPLKKLRRDCFYHCTPAMKIPRSLENVYSCENWLPRRVMSAWRIAGIVHALEGWNEHECGSAMSDINKVWEATLRHGFQPLIPNATPNKY